MDENEKLGAEEQALYRQITGLLLCIMADRFDIMFSWKQLCAKMSSANKHDFNALLHMCSYIQCQWNVDQDAGWDKSLGHVRSTHAPARREHRCADLADKSACD